MFNNKTRTLFCQISGYHPTEIKALKRLYGGMSNNIYYIKTKDNEEFVFRIPFPQSYHFVSYTIENTVLSLLKGQDFVQKTLYYDPCTGVKLATYLHGNPIKNASDPATINKVVTVLKKLHALPRIPQFNYEYETILANYEQLCVGMLPPLYFTLKKIWMQEYELNYQNLPLVFSHGDLQPSNLILNFQTNSINFLDFEFSRANNIYFDLASYGNVSFKDSQNLTRAYFFDSPNIESDLKKVMFFRFFQVLQWSVCALAKTKLGFGKVLKIDFEKYALDYLHQAEDFATTLALYDPGTTV
jgi:thiamine kinase-like enzyme